MNTYIVNSGDRDWTKHRFILCFGAYGWARCMVWANSLDGALDEAVDWIADHMPGLLADGEVQEAYDLAIAEGCGEDVAQERAEMDMVRAGNEGHYLPSWEWGLVAEDPTHAEVVALLKDAPAAPAPLLPPRPCH